MVREEIEKVKTSDNNIRLTRDMVRNIVSNGIKKRSEMGHHLDQTPIGFRHPTELQAGHLIIPSQTENTMRSSPVINVNPTQSVLKLPIFDINSGLDGNKTLVMMSSLNTGKRYKRENTLKFSEGSVETYESFRSSSTSIKRC